MSRLIAALAGVLLLVGLAAPAGAQLSTDLVSRSEFRVCADPHNLPFSNDKLLGFENKIAELIAKDLNEPVGYTWFPQTVGFVRNTLLANRCDVVMGTVSAGEMMDNTNPYYHSGYMIATRAEDGITASAIGDPALGGKRFGVIAGTPPTDLLLRHHLLAQTVSYSLLIDTRYESPSRQMLQDLMDKKIDVALLWGPYAGYDIAEEHLPLRADLLAGEPGGPKLDYYIAMGVRPGETAWRRTLNRSIVKHQEEITRILLGYHVPLLDAQNRLITDASTH